MLAHKMNISNLDCVYKNTSSLEVFYKHNNYCKKDLKNSGYKYPDIKCRKHNSDRRKKIEIENSFFPHHLTKWVALR